MRVLIKIVAALAIVHALFLLTFPHILHHMLGMKIREIVAETKTNSEEYIKEEILSYAYDKKIPIVPNEVIVWRKDDLVRIWLDYTEEVKLPFYTKVMEFHYAYPPGTILPRSMAYRTSSSRR